MQNFPVRGGESEGSRTHRAFGRIATGDRDNHIGGGLTIQPHAESDAATRLAGAGAAQGRDIHPGGVIIGNSDDRRCTARGICRRAKSGTDRLNVLCNLIIDNREGQAHFLDTSGNHHRATAQATIIASRRCATTDDIGHRHIIGARLAQDDPEGGAAHALAHQTGVGNQVHHWRRTRVNNRQGRRFRAAKGRATRRTERNECDLVPFLNRVRENRHRNRRSVYTRREVECAARCQIILANPGFRAPIAGCIMHTHRIRSRGTSGLDRNIDHCCRHALGLIC